MKLLAAISAALILTACNKTNSVAYHPAGEGKSEITTIKSLLDAFHRDCGRYPSTEEGLAALQIAPKEASHWHGPYGSRPITEDVFGNPITYSSDSDDQFKLKTLGADGKTGGKGEDADLEVTK